MACSHLFFICLILLFSLPLKALGSDVQAPLSPEIESSADVIFSGFVQNEISTYSRALAVATNISSRRVVFVRHGDRAGYAFGVNQIVRVNFLIRNADDSAEQSSTAARDALLSIVGSTSGVPRELQRLGVLEAFKVPTDSRLYTFKVYSTFDLFYTFIYVVTAVLYASFVAFVVYRFIRQCVAEGEDKKNEEKERKRLEAKREQAAAERKGVSKKEPVEAFDRSDVDKDMLAGVDVAAQRVLRRLRLLELEDEREQRSKHLRPQISQEVQHFLDVTTLPPPDDPSLDPLYRTGMRGRPPLVPVSDRSVTAIDIDEL